MGMIINPYAVQSAAVDIYTTSLLHLDGTNGSTSFVDVKGLSWTNDSTGAALSTADKKFGSASLLLNNSGTNGDVIKTASDPAFGFGSGSWTVEAWVKPLNTANQVNIVFDTRHGGAQGIACWVGGGQYGLNGNMIGISSNTAAILFGGDMPAGWNHVAWVRSGTTVGAWINGITAGTATDSRTLASSAIGAIGADSVATSLQQYRGYLDEFRVSKGIARYTPGQNFTPPSSPFPDS